MKRSVRILFYALALILMVFLVLFIGNRYHFIYDSACGTGIIGLKFAGIMAGFALVMIILWLWGENKMYKIHCKECKEVIEDTWKVCPYCGTER